MPHCPVLLVLLSLSFLPSSPPVSSIPLPSSTFPLSLPPPLHSSPQHTDFELQVAIVEGIFRITTGEERGRLAGSWFHSSRAAEMFTNIHESEFETVSLGGGGFNLL